MPIFSLIRKGLPRLALLIVCACFARVVFARTPTGGKREPTGNPNAWYQALCDKQLRTTTPEVWEEAAQAWVKLWDKAARPEAGWHQAVACAPNAAAKALLEGLGAYNQGLFDHAEDLWTQAMTHAPEAWQAGLRQNLAWLALHRQQPQKALALLAHAQRQDNQRVSLRLATAQAYLALNQPEHIGATLRPLTCCTAVPTQKQKQQAERLIFEAFDAMRGELSKIEATALKNVRRLVADPNAAQQDMLEMTLNLAQSYPKPSIQTEAALLALKQGVLSQGRHLARLAFKAAPWDPDPARVLALYNMQEHDPNRTLACLEHAAACDPFNIETQLWVADLAEKQSQWAKAATARQALSRLEPHDPNHQTALRRIYHAQQKQPRTRDVPQAPPSMP